MTLKKLKAQLHIEIDTAFLYQKLAENYQDKFAAEILKKMAAIEERHAQKVLLKIREIDPHFMPFKPSLRAQLQYRLGKCFGFEFILANLAVLEANLAQAAIRQKHSTGETVTGLENVHLNIIQQISLQTPYQVGGSLLRRFEGKHKTVGGNELRAAVLGANDGLVSNLSLLTGMVGAATQHADILIAGLAGLLAGSLSMALGEWLSVQSSRELYQKQIEIEAEELENSPEEEMYELALLYQAKGIEMKDAFKMAKEVLSNPETALDSLVKEELGIDSSALGGSAWKAAFTSFFLFGIGAIIPLLPFLFSSGAQAIQWCLITSALGLFSIGATITLFTGKNALYSGLRQVLFGGVAAGITHLIGKMIGGGLL